MPGKVFWGMIYPFAVMILVGFTAYVFYNIAMTPH